MCAASEQDPTVPETASRKAAGDSQRRGNPQPCGTGCAFPWKPGKAAGASQLAQTSPSPGTETQNSWECFSKMPMSCFQLFYIYDCITVRLLRVLIL